MTRNIYKKIKNSFKRSKKDTESTPIATSAQDNLVHNTIDNFSCNLPTNLGVTVPTAFKLLSSRIDMDEEQINKIKQIPESSIVVYASKYRNYAGFFYFYSKFKNTKLPRPTMGLEHNVYLLQPVSKMYKMIVSNTKFFFKNFTLPNPYKNGYVKDQLVVNGKTAFISLVGSKSFYNWFVKKKTDPVKYLINIQKTIKQPVIIIPQLMFFNKTPLKSNPTVLDMLFGDCEKPGFMKKIIGLCKRNKKAFTQIANPVNIQTFLERPDIQSLSTQQQALLLRQHLITRLNKHRQSVIGPALKSHEELKEDILTEKKLQSFMTNHAYETKTPIQHIHKKAESYLDEIASNYNLSTIKIFSVFLTWAFKNIFNGISVDTGELNKAKEASKNAPIVMVPCHKSHLDYLLMSYILYDNNMPCPHIAAGKNLSFWPLGSIFRSCGAFFLRRTFKGLPLYKKVFSAYLQKLLIEGFSVEFFIEGGRSRSGKLLSPKLGLLSIILDAYANGEIEDVVFVPTYIGYDRVLEEKSYLHELEGGKKEEESFFQILKARKMLKVRYGKVYIKFHKPISLKDYLSDNGYQIKSLSKEMYKTICSDLGYKFIHAINNVSIVTPHGLVAMSLLSNPKPRFVYEQFVFQLETYMNYLLSQKTALADTLTFEPELIRDHVLDGFIQRKFINCDRDKDAENFAEAGLSVKESKRPILNYYKNNCIFFFIPAAYTALAIFEMDAFQFSAKELTETYEFLRRLFNDEFSHAQNESSNSYVEKTLKLFVKNDIIVPHQTVPDVYNLVSVGYRKLTFFTNILKSFFESYLVVSSYFDEYGNDEEKNTKDHIKKIQSVGTKMYKKSQIETAEALSKINFQNGLKFFLSEYPKNNIKDSSISYDQNNINQDNKSDNIVDYTGRIQKYLSILTS